MLVWFSSSTGLPDVAENDAWANPRGLAVRFFFPKGSAIDLVGQPVDGFPTRAPEELLRLLRVTSHRTIAPGAFELYLQKKPAAAILIASIPSTPRSFATERFSMLHDFVLSGPENGISIGRSHVQPKAGPDRLTRRQANDRTGNFLTNEIIERVSTGGYDVDLVLQLALARDWTDDISTGWSDNRREVTLGTLFLDRKARDQGEQIHILLDLARLTPGTAACGNPMLHVRNAAYHTDFRRHMAADPGDAGAVATGLAPSPAYPFPMQRSSS